MTSMKKIGQLMLCVLFGWMTAGGLAAQEFGQQVVRGYTEPFAEVEIASPEPGVIEKVCVEKGDYVKTGDILIELDNEVLKATLAIEEAKRNDRQKQVAAEKELEHWLQRQVHLKHLQEKNYASTSEIERMDFDVESAKLRLDTARFEEELDELQYEKIKAMIDRRQVRSTIDGVIVDVYKQPGEAVSVGDPNVARVVNVDQLKVSFAVKPEFARHFTQGETVVVEFPESGEKAEGVIKYKSSIVDPRSGTVEIMVVIENEGHVIAGGSLCTIEFPEAAPESDSLTESNR